MEEYQKGKNEEDVKDIKTKEDVDSKTLKTENTLEVSNLLLNETDLNKEIKDIQSKSKSDSHPTLDSINLIRNDIADTVGALNFQKEQNHAEEESIEDLKLLLSSLKELVNYAETEFTTKCLDEFDKCFFVDSKPQTNAVELYKSITNLLKRVEKEYEFNAIDPIDEERDYTDLKKKLIAYEKHKLNVIKSESQDDLLSHEDKSKLFKIDEIKDLNELKRLEDLIIGVLTKKNIKIGYNLDAIENSTLELSNGYFKKAIFKERDKMINNKSELVTKQIELNCIKRRICAEKLDAVETSFKPEFKQDSFIL